MTDQIGVPMEKLLEEGVVEFYKAMGPACIVPEAILD